ncbi:MAG TPA: GTP-binding protein [Aquifex aeolicus]|uniref:GTP-binding protein n=1 Tax=Aquifex aeolicus TaxID=63363 RepID=A0A9D0YPF6_AQUAO|nr:GTP-binding protein [Aquifex aeolicus]
MAKDKKVFKILITGSFGSGKTTFVKNISEIDPLLTEKNISRPENRSEDKQTTTVAIDMGKLKVGDDVEVYLFSTPGQERFDFMFDILSKGILGAIILVDATSNESIEVAENLAKKIRERFDIPILYAVTKLDLPNAKSLEEIKAFLSTMEDIPVEPLNPMDKESGKEVLVKLLSKIFS